MEVQPSTNRDLEHSARTGEQLDIKCDHILALTLRNVQKESSPMDAEDTTERG